jgi:hypothetical protein
MIASSCALAQLRHYQTRKSLRRPIEIGATGSNGLRGSCEGQAGSASYKLVRYAVIHRESCTNFKIGTIRDENREVPGPLVKFTSSVRILPVTASSVPWSDTIMSFASSAQLAHAPNNSNIERATTHWHGRALE